MKGALTGALWRLTVFTIVGALGTFALLMVFAELRFQPEMSYRAEFTDASGLRKGDFVRVAGVEVGKVQNVTVRPDNLATVEFSAEDSVVLTENTRVVIRWDDIIGGRFIELLDSGSSVSARLHPGAVIPADRTEPALDLDALIGGFRPLFRALDPDQVNALSGQLIHAFQGQGTAIGSLLAQTAALTNTIADRDELIGAVIVNLNTVLGSLDAHSGQLATAIDTLSELIDGLAARGGEIADAVAHTNAAAGSIADLLHRVRPPLKEVITQADRVASLALTDHEYLDGYLATLPDAYRALARQGIYGDYFSFYVCDLVLKMNGKGGQPVYVKVAGQDSGRCAPR
ncbi:MCE family protein [Mycolicibacterium thermoresistibile]